MSNIIPVELGLLPSENFFGWDASRTISDTIPGANLLDFKQVDERDGKKKTWKIYCGTGEFVKEDGTHVPLSVHYGSYGTEKDYRTVMNSFSTSTDKFGEDAVKVSNYLVDKPAIFGLNSFLLSHKGSTELPLLFGAVSLAIATSFIPIDHRVWDETSFIGGMFLGGFLGYKIGQWNFKRNRNKVRQEVSDDTLLVGTKAYDTLKRAEDRSIDNYIGHELQERVALPAEVSMNLALNHSPREARDIRRREHKESLRKNRVWAEETDNLGLLVDSVETGGKLAVANAYKPIGNNT